MTIVIVLLVLILIALGGTAFLGPLSISNPLVIIGIILLVLLLAGAIKFRGR